MAKKRVLSAADRALWDRVASEATPLKGARGQLKGSTAPAAPMKAAPALREPQTPWQKPAPPPLRAQPRVTFDLIDPAPAKVGRPEPGLDRRTAERLRRGERAPDARLDLHGMTAERAHGALDGFIARALGAGLRCVLVITGKGGRFTPEDAAFMRPDRGVLRQMAPRWLKAGRFARQIVGIYEAHPRHGGAGAFYVYLKKSG
ncbi:MAG: Smr/MutS family protein [Pseudomonadota bacterium]